MGSLLDSQKPIFIRTNCQQSCKERKKTRYACPSKEVQLFATIRLSGHHVCADCAWSHRVLPVAITSDDAEAAGLPPSAGITLTANDTEISQTVQLPVRGHPIHSPFDRYDLCLGVVYPRIYPRIYPDGTQETLSATQARGHLFLSLQELLPRNTTAPAPARCAV